MADYNSGDLSDEPNASQYPNGSAANGTNNGTSNGNGRGMTHAGNGLTTAPANAQGIHGAALPPMNYASGAAHMLDAGTDGLVQILGRQWHVIVVGGIIALLLSVVYLMVTKPVYTSVSTVRVTPLDPQTLASNTANISAADGGQFLDTECAVIKSNSVVALAMEKIRGTKTLKGMSHPMDYVRSHLSADIAKKGAAIEVSFESTSEADANLIVDSIVEAYKNYESESWKNRANEVLKTWDGGSKHQIDDLVDHETKMNEIVRKNGYVPDIDPAKNPKHLEVLSLQSAKEAAQLNVVRAHNAYQQAAKATIGQPRLLELVDQALQKPRGFSTTPEEQLKEYQKELGIEQAKLVDDSRNFGPSHPTIITDQARVDQMIVLTVISAKEWEEYAQNEFDAIDKSLAAANRAEVAAADSQRDYMQLQLEVEQLKKASADVADRRREIERTMGAGALNINVLNPAEVIDPPKPGKGKTLAIGLVLGVIAGLGFACVRDYTDDKMRSPAAVRASAGAPVLGAIPMITTAYTAADRGQIVHHDPFGEAAESYRTLRTALQFGLPASTKTLLVTSPVSGDGKSTFVSNLGIAMAQASRRVLIIDADLRAPMQHRLFGLKDRVGLATVLAGSDTMAQAIQRTEIEGLDVLPCGPTPTNPAELLNSEAFLDQLNELADRYDLVILDSPPVTAVADARILAASTDASLLVIRLDSSTRKQTEAARDGIRSVGGRLIGVAVNGASSSGHFGGASGYYAHGDNVPLAARSGRRSKVPAGETVRS